MANWAWLADPEIASDEDVHGFRTPFMTFAEPRRGALHTEHPGWTLQDINASVASDWGVLLPDQKLVFSEQCRQSRPAVPASSQTRKAKSAVGSSPSVSAPTTPVGMREPMLCIDIPEGCELKAIAVRARHAELLMELDKELTAVGAGQISAERLVQIVSQRGR